MQLQMPPLTTPRLLIRRFEPGDLDAIHPILDMEADEGHKLEERAAWLEWSVRNYDALERLYQPPYGERAVVLRSSGGLIGAVGLVPSYNFFAQIPGLGPDPLPKAPARFAQAEVGLFWAIEKRQRNQGYASEAARALIDFAFTDLSLARIVATTTYDNLASEAVMRRLGMRVERNPFAEPPYLQVVGMLQNPG
jgi:RimJ/RimL family protein N-acetyltransferase